MEICKTKYIILPISNYLGLYVKNKAFKKKHTHIDLKDRKEKQISNFPVKKDCCGIIVGCMEISKGSEMNSDTQSE